LTTFEDHVQAALDALPEEIAAALENVAVVVEDENSEEPTLFGWYSGLGPARDHAGALPDQIVIYRRPLERAFHDPEELERQIRITVLHEVGHYFGLDEDRIDELGYG
jgi:predicted Zn-dependent protease with MMP-like domain